MDLDMTQVLELSGCEFKITVIYMGFPRWSQWSRTRLPVRETQETQFDPWVRKIPWDLPVLGDGNPLQYSCGENPTDPGAWQAIVHRVAKSQTQLKRLDTQHISYTCSNFQRERGTTFTNKWGIDTVRVRQTEMLETQS